MIPVSLTIKGLYSYREETTIDFTNLTAAGLFGIFGSVGSGKSSILEAISFALYGETERLNKTDKRSYNMMNLRSKHLLINFVFTCGDCDFKYKFTVSAKRNSKNFNDGGKIERQAYIWQNSWLPTELDAETILGLSYDNFKRTIIIPQGKFQEFLQLKDTERVQMLKEIFSLNKFELSPKVAQLTKENEIKVSHLQGQMQSLPAYDEDLLKEKQTSIDLLEKNVKELAVKLKSKQAEEISLQELKGQFEDLHKKTNDLNALQKRKGEIDELSRQVAEFEKCEGAFKYPIENRNQLYQSIIKQQVEAKKLQADKVSLTTTITSEEHKIVQLKDNYTNREQLIQKATEFEKVISIKTLDEKITNLTTRIAKGNKAIDDEEKKLEAHKQQTAAIKEDMLSAEQSLPDELKLIAISSWFKGREQRINSSKNAEQELANTLANLSRIKSEIENKLTQLPGEIRLAGFPETLSFVKGEIATLSQVYTEQLRILKDEQNHLKFYQKLDEFSKALNDKSECPLCGSLHHPKVFSAADASRDIGQKQTVICDIENKQAILHTTLVSLSGFYSSYEMYSLQYNQQKKEALRQQKDLENYTNSFSFNGYNVNDEERVNKQLSEIEVKDTEIKKLRKQRDEKEKEIELSTKNVATYKIGIDSLRTEKAQHEGKLEALIAQISLLDLSIEKNKTAIDLGRHVEALKQSYSQVTKEYEESSKAMQENNKRLAALVGGLNELEKQVSSSILQHDELDNLIQSLLTREGYQVEADVEKVLATKCDVKKERETIEAFRRELHTAAIQYTEATKKVGGKVYNEATHTELQQNVLDLTKDLADKTNRQVEEKFEMQELNQRMQLRSALQKNLETLVVRAENLKVLSNLFRSSGFVNYVSSVYLQNLVNSANHRFYKMTRQKLLLELADDNAFRVRDFMNNGEVRSVKTLSGGQTFQAALALALALADNIQHLTKSKQNFFFLDEGFGSLDKDALAIVFDTLKGLRKENRIVGVISHVDEMQQEIPVNLKIVNDPERGSLVATSWN